MSHPPKSSQSNFWEFSQLSPEPKFLSPSSQLLHKSGWSQCHNHDEADDDDHDDEGKDDEDDHVHDRGDDITIKIKKIL